MEEDDIREKLRKISDVMNGFSLETVKIANLQADVCGLKKDNTVLIREISSVKQENIELKGEVNTHKHKITTLEGKITTLEGENTALGGKITTLEGENTALGGKITALGGENTTLEVKVSKLGMENSVIRNILDSLRNDVHMLKHTVGQRSNEEYSSSGGAEKNVASGSNEIDSVKPKSNYELDGAKKVIDLASDGSNGSGDGAKDESNLAQRKQISKKPKTQRKREQDEIFRNWCRTMTQRKTGQELWASGLLKVTIELWEDGTTCMDGNQMLDFVQRNVDEIAAHVSSIEGAQRLFLTLIKMCTARQIPKPKFEEIVQCFENKGPSHSRITNEQIKDFLAKYSK